MQGRAASEAAKGSALCGTSAELIRAFRSRHALTPERLATLLDIEPEMLRRFEDAGVAPRWVAYALVGLGYERFGVAPVGAGEADSRRTANTCPRPGVGSDGASAAGDMAR